MYLYTNKYMRKRISISTQLQKSMTLVSLKAIISPHMNAIYFPLKPGFLSAIFCAVPLLLPGFHIHYSPLPLQHTACCLASLYWNYYQSDTCFFLHLKREDEGSRLCINEQKFSHSPLAAAAALVS